MRFKNVSSAVNASFSSGINKFFQLGLSSQGQNLAILERLQNVQVYQAPEMHLWYQK